MRRIITLVCLIAAALLAPAWQPTATRAQDAPPIVYRNSNTELTLDANGHLNVRMFQQLAFDGEFSSAFFDIPTDFTTGIDDVRVWRGATAADDLNLATPDLVPVTPDALEDRGDIVSVEWSYPRTQPGDVRLFVIEYTARSVVWVYSDHDLVNWQAVNAERSGVPVESSTVTLTLPREIPIDTVIPSAEPAATITTAGRTVTYTATGPLPDGVPFTVMAEFPHGLLGLSAPDWQADQDHAPLDVQIDRGHSDITVEPNGDLLVRETTDFRIVEGALHYGFLSRSLLYADAIEVEEVLLDGEPLEAEWMPCHGCYTVSQTPRPAGWVYLDRSAGTMVIQEDNAGRIDIDLTLPAPLWRGGSAQLEVVYRVKGALRVADDSQLLSWQVLPDFGLPIQTATMRLVLPPGVTADAVTVEGPPDQGPGRPDGASVLQYRFDGPVYPGGWQVAITLPADATAAPVPAWQTDLERVLAEVDAAAVARARQTLVRRILGVLALIGAALGGLLGWFWWGRRRVRETLGGFISEPPSLLSPAVVEFLVDRNATEKGILGAILHLAVFGLLEVDLDGGIRLRRTRDAALGPRPRVKGPGGNTVVLAEHLRLLYDEVLWPNLKPDAWTMLDALAPSLRAKLPEVYAQLSRDIQQEFIAVPGRRRLGGAAGALWLILTLAVAGSALLGAFGVGFAFLLSVGAGFLILIVGSGASAASGKYSAAAEQEADQWRRFRTYLTDIKRYGDQGEAQAILDRYFGYAIALHVVDVVLAQVGATNVRPPRWLPSVSPTWDRESTSRPQSQTQQPSSRPAWTPPRPAPATPQAEAPAPAAGLPSFAEMSVQLGDTLRRASSDLGALLQTAAGDASGAPRTVVLDSRLQRRELTWQPGAPVGKVLDDLLHQGVSDARAIQTREADRRRREADAAAQAAAVRRAASRGSGSSGSSSSRASGGFGSRSGSSSFSRSSSSSSSRSSSSSSSRGSSSRSGGGGRSGFR